VSPVQNRVLIHIGYPKCASTYLQKQVFPRLGNYSNMAFAPRDEKYYPLRTEFDPAEFRRLVERHTVNPDPAKPHLVISCEDWVELLAKEFEEVFFRFNGLDRSRHRFANEVILKNLHAAYPEAEILFVIREPLSYILSRYKMLYRGAKTSKSLGAFLERPTEGYAEAIERAQALFGRERVHVVPFERLKQDSQSFVDEVVRLVDPDAHVDASTERVNAAPELRSEVEYERRKKEIRFRLEQGGRSPIARLAYLAARAWMAATLWPRLRRQYGAEPFRVPFDPEWAQRFAEQNRRVEGLTGLRLQNLGYRTD